MYLLTVLFITLHLFHNITSADTNLTEKVEEEDILESESVRGGKFLSLSENDPLKKSVSCNSKNCKVPYFSDTTTQNIENFVIESYEFTETPLKSYNFLAKMPTVAPKDRKLPKERISIYQLNEKSPAGGKMHDWPVDYEYEVNAEEKEEEGVEGERGDYFSEEGTTQGQTRVTGKQTSVQLDIKKNVHSIDKTIKGLMPKVEMITKKNKSKFQNVGKQYKIVQGTTKSDDRGRTEFSELSKEIHSITQKTSLTSPETIKQKKFLPPSLLRNNSFRFFPYPVYFTAKPIVHEKKLVIPYPYFVLKTNKETLLNITNLENGNHSISINNSNDLPEKSIKPKEDTFNVEIVYSDNDNEMENDEDYDPSPDTVYPDYGDQTTPTETTYKRTTPTGTSIESSEIKTDKEETTLYPVQSVTTPSEILSTTKGFTFFFNVTINNTPKYPDPYKNGSIYSYYDCEALIDRAQGKPKSLALYVLIMTLSFSTVNVYII